MGGGYGLCLWRVLYAVCVRLASAALRRAPRAPSGAFASRDRNSYYVLYLACRSAARTAGDERRRCPPTGIGRLDRTGAGQTRTRHPTATPRTRPTPARLAAALGPARRGVSRPMRYRWVLCARCRAEGHTRGSVDDDVCAIPQFIVKANRTVWGLHYIRVYKLFGTISRNDRLERRRESAKPQRVSVTVRDETTES